MIKALIEYQNQDAQKKEIENVLLNSEERKKRNTAKKYILGVEESVNKLDDKALELKSALDGISQKQSQLSEQQAELTQAVNSVNDEKEASFLIKKVDELMAKMKALSADADKISKELVAVLAEYDKIKKTTKAAQAQYKENNDKYRELENSFKDKQDQIQKVLDELSKKVDGALMQRYLKKREDKMYPIVYEIKGNSCGYCRMELSMADMNKLKNGEVIDCEQCGRLIYLDQK